MSGANLYYPWADIASDAGLVVKVTDTNAGWERRARSSGGFPVVPLGVVWHHAASSDSMSDEACVNYQVRGNPDAPVGNITLGRDGSVWPVAGGASNCAGQSERAIAFSRGTCPEDQGNTYLVNIEVNNNGVGGPWSVQLIDCDFALSNAINAYLGNQPDDVITHALGAGDGYTNRKIDPATAAAVQGLWQPRSCNSSGTWMLADIKAECLARAGSAPTPRPPTPTPTGKDSKVYVILVQNGDPQGRTFVSDLTTKTYIPNPDALAALQVTLAGAGLDNQVHYVDSNQMAGYGLLTAPVPGLDDYGAMT